MIFVTTYQRPNMLMRLLQELHGEDVIVFDDGSEYDATPFYQYCDYRRVSHQGKENFWQLWQLMLTTAQYSGRDEFIFLQDDLYNVDLEGLRQVETPDKYALNLMNVGPDRGWSPAGYVDCIFKTNRATLDEIGWYVDPVSPCRWTINPGMSSGVGQNLSRRFYEHRMPMILPDKNYASHGDHESMMNPKERQKNPLICKTGS